MSDMKVDTTVVLLYSNPKDKNMTTGSLDNRFCEQHVRETHVDKPRRPLSGYNIFFQLERDRIVKGEIERSFTANDVANVRIYASGQKPKRRDRKIHGKIAFAELARRIASKWNTLSYCDRIVFEDRSKLEKEKYQRDLKTWIGQKKARFTTKTQKMKRLSAVYDTTKTICVNEADPKTAFAIPTPMNGDVYLASNISAVSILKLGNTVTSPPSCFPPKPLNQNEAYCWERRLSINEVLASAVQVHQQSLPDGVSQSLIPDWISKFNDVLMPEPITPQNIRVVMGNLLPDIPSIACYDYYSEAPLLVRNNDLDLLAYLEDVIEFDNGVLDLAQMPIDVESHQTVHEGSVIDDEITFQNPFSSSCVKMTSSVSLLETIAHVEDDIDSALFVEGHELLPTASDLCKIFC
jgi:hypothetical protein